MGQFVRFGIVGACGVVVNMVVAILLNKAHGGTSKANDVVWHVSGTDFNLRFTVIVWIVGFLVANCVNFQLNRTWTFKSSKHASWWSEFWPFLAVGSVAAIVGMFLKVGFTNPTSPIYLSSSFFHEGAGLHSREYWAQIITIVITMPINFAVNKLWTFRAVRSPIASPDDPNQPPASSEPAISSGPATSSEAMDN